MKILIFNWRDIKNPKAGGAEIYFHEILKRAVNSGHSVSWICGGWKGCQKEEIIDGIKIVRIGEEMSLYLLAPLAYFKLKEKPDIIIDVENGIPFFTPFFSRKKKILHIHHVHKEVWAKETEGKGIKSKLIGYIGKFLELKIMPFAYRKTGVTTLSNSSKEEIEKEKLGKVIGIVSPGIEFYKFKKFEKTSKPSVLFLNRIKKYKGIDTFLEAIKYLREKNYKDFEVFIAGSGDYLNEAISYAKKNELNNVNFLGKISEEEKKEFMQKSWVFVNPSFKEGWGIVNIEANYFGTPVIGSDVGGIRDSVIDGKTGLLFSYGNKEELADKIKKLIEDKSLRQRMEKNGKEWAKRFDWDLMTRDFLKIIEKY